MRIKSEGRLATGASFALGGGPGRLMGLSLRETTGAAGAQVEVVDGTDSQGEPVMTVALSPGESTREWFGPHGILLERGCFYQVNSGTVDAFAFVAFDSDQERG